MPAVHTSTAKHFILFADNVPKFRLDKPGEHLPAAVLCVAAVSGWSAYYGRPKIVVLRSAPIPLPQQHLLLRAAQEVFTTEECIHPGVFASHYRALLVSCVTSLFLSDLHEHYFCCYRVVVKVI